MQAPPRVSSCSRWQAAPLKQVLNLQQATDPSVVVLGPVSLHCHVHISSAVDMADSFTQSAPQTPQGTSSQAGSADACLGGLPRPSLSNHHHHLVLADDLQQLIPAVVDRQEAPLLLQRLALRKVADGLQARNIGSVRCDPASLPKGGQQGRCWGGTSEGTGNEQELGIKVIGGSVWAASLLMRR